MSWILEIQTRHLYLSLRPKVLVLRGIGLQGYEIHKTNVAVLNAEVGQGSDPGVRSAPFVKTKEGVRCTQIENVDFNKVYAMSGAENAS